MIPEVDRRRLHKELRRANPHMSYKERCKALDQANIVLFIRWLGSKEGLKFMRASGVHDGV